MSDEKILADILAASNACAKYQREPAGRDRWQTPAELKASGAGDCEDFAIDAMARLEGLPGHARLGWCLRLDSGKKIGHMVCLYHDGADQWVLDVNSDAPCLLSERPDLEVVMELDTDGVYFRHEVKPVSLIPEWANVLMRKSKE